MDADTRQLTPSDYPAALREIPDVPSALFVRGSLAPQGTKSLAVVGSRALSPYGRTACTDLVKGLRGRPVSIVSGLALGADACAHEAALEAELHTVAVLGSGVSDSAISPRTNLPLAKRILEAGGALVSENPPQHVPFPSDFPKRNRIVAGLSDAILIVEAGERSGTLITARLASEYNRDLLCIPHRIGDPGGYGAHRFIRLGAALVSEPSHILEALGLAEDPPVQESLLASPEETLLSLLPARKDDLIRASKLPSPEALTALVTLEMKGLVRERYGRWERV